MTASHPVGEPVISARVSWLVQTTFVALGFAAIDLLWLLKPGVESTQHALYHWSGGFKSLFLPIAIDTIGFWAALTLLLVIGRKPGRTRVAIWAGLLFFMPWVILQNLSMLVWNVPTHQWDRILFLGAILATAALTAWWRPSFALRFEKVVEVASTVLVFAGVFGVFLLCRLALHAREASMLMAKFPLHHATAPATIQPHRIIWIVMDELSYQQVYERRFPGLELPAFDALAKQATSFSHVVIPSIYTEIVLPGLLAGKPYDDIRTSPTGDFFVHDPTTKTWQLFNQHNTIFQDALDSGYSTAVAGWYNPYCHILPQVLDQCSWTLRIENTNGMVPAETVAFNSLESVKWLGARVLSIVPRRPQAYLMQLLHIPVMRVTTTRLHIVDYKEVSAASDQLIRDRSAGFILLHLPVPHPWGIWDRKTNDFTTNGSSYVNNLALADKCLAELRATLEETGQWDASTIVLMGDHGWRTTQLWRVPQIGFAWDQEDEEASRGGQFDGRPAYLVKLPGQTVGNRVDTPFHSVNTRQLFDAILSHKINTAADTAAWAESVK